MSLLYGTAGQLYLDLEDCKQSKADRGEEVLLFLWVFSMGQQDSSTKSRYLTCAIP